MAKAKNPSASALAAEVAKLSYEEASSMLESLLARLEQQKIPLDEVLSAYQRGQALLAHCRGKLQAVEQQIQTLDAAADSEDQNGARA